MRQRKERDTWTFRYAEWCRRQGRTTQCNPVLLIPVAIVVFGVMVYVYRQVIITTLITAVLAALAVTAFVSIIALLISTLRWYRKREKLMAARPDAAVALATATSDKDATALSEEADWLADAGSELVFDKDGNLHAKTGS